MSWRDRRNVMMTNMYERVFSSTKKRDIKASDVVFFFYSTKSMFICCNGDIIFKSFLRS